MAFMACNGSYSLGPDWPKIVQRLDHIEESNVALLHDNTMLRKKVSELEDGVGRLARQVNDTASKVRVMRETNLAPAVLRLLDTFDVMEYILGLCPRKQLFSIQTVCKSLFRTIDASSRLRSRMFSNASDVLLRKVDSSEADAIWRRLALNPLFVESWTTTDFAIFIHLRIFKSAQNLARYLVDTDLMTTFECKIVSSEQSHYAMNQLRTSLGRTYMTSPALPTTIWVAFLVPSLIKDPGERQRAMRSPTSVPPNVTAVVEVIPATLLEMYEVAEVMRKYFPRNSIGDPKDVEWNPFSSPLAEHDGMLHRALALMHSRPQYAGWRVAQSRAHSMSDITDWL